MQTGQVRTRATVADPLHVFYAGEACVPPLNLYPHRPYLDRTRIAVWAVRVTTKNAVRGVWVYGWNLKTPAWVAGMIKWVSKATVLLNEAKALPHRRRLRSR